MTSELWSENEIVALTQLLPTINIQDWTSKKWSKTTTWDESNYLKVIHWAFLKVMQTDNLLNLSDIATYINYFNLFSTQIDFVQFWSEKHPRKRGKYWPYLKSLVKRFCEDYLPSDILQKTEQILDMIHSQPKGQKRKQIESDKSSAKRTNVTQDASDVIKTKCLLIPKQNVDVHVAKEKVSKKCKLEQTKKISNITFEKEMLIVKDIEYTDDKTTDDMKLNEFMESWVPIASHFENITNQNRIIFAGLYPPANAEVEKPLNNPTSTNLVHMLDHSHFDWIDIYPKSPQGTNKDASNSLSKFLKMKGNETYRQVWVENVLKRCNDIQEKGFVPVVYVCGEDCKYQWNIYEWGLFGFKINQIVTDITTYENDNVFFICFQSQHPSYILHNNTVENYCQSTTDIKILNFLRENGVDNVWDFIKRFKQEEKNRDPNIKALLVDLNLKLNTDQSEFLYRFPFENNEYKDWISQFLSRLKCSISNCICVNKTTCHPFVTNCVWESDIVELLYSSKFLNACYIPNYRIWLDDIFLEICKTDIIFKDMKPYNNMIRFLKRTVLSKYGSTISKLFVDSEFREKLLTCVYIATNDDKQILFELLMNPGFYLGVTKSSHYCNEIKSCIKYPELKYLICHSSTFAKKLAENPDFYKEDWMRYENKLCFQTLYQHDNYVENIKHIPTFWSDNLSPANLQRALCNPQFITNMTNISFQNYILKILIPFLQNRFQNNALQHMSDEIDMIPKGIETYVVPFLECPQFCSNFENFHNQFKNVFDLLTIDDLICGSKTVFEMSVFLTTLDGFFHKNRDVDCMLKNFRDVLMLEKSNLNAWEITCILFQNNRFIRRIIDKMFYSFFETCVEQLGLSNTAKCFTVNRVLENMFPYINQKFQLRVDIDINQTIARWQELFLSNFPKDENNILLGIAASSGIINSRYGTPFCSVCCVK